ncbi:MAG: SulP family inorganic anion transporter [Geminicoccaceae bacterium]
MVSSTAGDDAGGPGLRWIAQIVSAGIVIGAMSVVFALSFAAIVYSGPLTPYLNQGIGLTLIGAVVMGSLGALTLSYRGTICQPQDITAILLALAAATLVGSGLDPAAAFATVVVLVGLSAIATGVIAYGMGRMQLGYLVRYVPLPVISGFLAATGVLLIRGAFEMAVPGAPAGIGLLAHLAEQWPRWLPWFGLAAAIAILVRVAATGFVIPAALLAATIVFYLSLPLLALDLDAARAARLLLGPFEDQTFVGGLGLDLVRRADWLALLSQIPMMLAIIGMSILGILLNASGLELALKREIDLDRDLKGVGIANMTAGLGGGMVGYHLLGETLLAKRIGIGGMSAGFSVAAVCAAGLLFGAELLSNLPLGLFAAVIWFLGFDLLLTALHDHGWRMPWRDLAVVLVTLAIALAYGFLPAVGFGMLVACLLFVVAYASVDVVRLSTSGAAFRARIERSPEDYRRLSELGGCVQIYRLSGFLFFGSAHQLVERLQRRRKGARQPSIVLLDLKRVVGLDMSAWAALERLARRCQEQGCRLVLTGLSPHLAKRFKRWIASSEADNLEIAGGLDDVLERIEEGLLAEHPLAAAQAGSGASPNEHEGLAALLEEYGERMQLAPGDVVLAEGARSDHLVVLLSGRFRVTVTDRRGLTNTVTRLLPGAILGEVSYYADVPRTASVVAETQATAVRLDADALARMERESPAQAAAFHHSLARILARRLMASTQLLMDAEV